METYPAIRHYEPPLNSAMRTPYDHAVESDGEDDPMWDDYFDPKFAQISRSFRSVESVRAGPRRCSWTHADPRPARC
jgi:hypothetical protein